MGQASRGSPRPHALMAALKSLGSAPRTISRRPFLGSVDENGPDPKHHRVPVGTFGYQNLTRSEIRYRSDCRGACSRHRDFGRTIRLRVRAVTSETPAHDRAAETHERLESGVLATYLDG